MQRERTIKITQGMVQSIHPNLRRFLSVKRMPPEQWISIVKLSRDLETKFYGNSPPPYAEFM